MSTPRPAPHITVLPPGGVYPNICKYNLFLEKEWVGLEFVVRFENREFVEINNLYQ